ncbi:DUF3078 domain-containing protein [Flavobacterium sp.]|jgi:hypothetical protein|uniref:DUF3078 domain-containing protein n=1 Tax=Flavobacterium sp. TaxID=239 RepID=UPI0038D05812
MKKGVLVFSFLLLVTNFYGQTSEKEFLKKTEEIISKIDADRPNGWYKKGMFTFLANQATFENWLAGGQSNISGSLGLNYDINYKGDSWTWDNKIIAAYGLTKIKYQEMQKSDDRLLFSSLLGKKAGGEWFYSAFLNFKTQFDSGFESGVKTSHFFSPAYFQFGPGMLWKKSDNLKINIAPATSKIILVDSRFTQNGSSFGVLQGHSSRYEFGAAVNAYYKFKLMENVVVENILNLYSNYSESPENIDIDNTINVTMKVNKYLTTNFALQTIYDDNAFPGLQIRQVIGLGVNYGF